MQNGFLLYTEYIENFDADREVCRKMVFNFFLGKVLVPQYCKIKIQEKKLP